MQEWRLPDMDFLKILLLIYKTSIVAMVILLLVAFLKI
jgi:hypothetical protein